MSATRGPGPWPEVEPLSDLAWARIERDLFAVLDDAPAAEATPAPAPVAARPRVRARRLMLAAGAALLGAAAALLLFVGLRGDAVPEASIRTARVVTGEAPSHYTVGDAELEVAPQSAIFIDTDARRGVRVILERGRVDFAVAPRQGRAPLSVLAGDVRVEVAGTVFSVTRVGDGARVEVREGQVRVLSGGRIAVVEAGEAWPVEEASARGPAEADEPRPRSRRRARTRDEGPDDARAARAAREVGAAALTARERFERAARLEASDPDAAAAIYSALSREGGPWAAPALYAQARLAVERGHAAAAERLLRRYLELHPDGANAADARELLDRRR